MDHSIDGFSIFGLIVFGLAVFCVVHPLQIPLPINFSRLVWATAKTLRLVEEAKDTRLHLHFNLVTTPLLGLLILLITTTVDGSVIRLGIVGQDGGRPYDVLVLFFSLAYIATSLDATGALRYLAFTVSQKGNGSGVLLYAALYAFFFLSAVIIGNDPIVLSGTAFLAYFTRVTGIVPPTAWTYSEFIAANTASAVLVSSNPTNILIAGAFDLNYITGYTKFTIIPSMVSAVLGLPLLFLMFRWSKPPKDAHAAASPPDTPALERTSSPLDAPERREKRSYIPARIYPPDSDARSALVDPSGAVFHVTLLLTTLVVIVGTTFVQPPPGVWSITMPAGIIAFLRDLFVDWKQHRMGPVEAREAAAPPEVAGDALKPDADASEYPPKAPAESHNGAVERERLTLPALWRRFARRFPSTANVLTHLPFPLLPFAVGMFCLVQALDYLGWVAVFANWLYIAAPTPAKAAFIVGPLVAFVLCVIAGTNIGAAVLGVAHPSYAGRVSPQTLNAAIFALAMGSNLGAFGWALSASLAGLLWARILRQKGVVVKQLDFAYWNALPLVVLTMVSCTIVWAQTRFLL